MTDGVYVWPSYLAYYVDNYDIELSHEFGAHMRACNWNLPRLIDVKQLKLPFVD